MSTITIDLALAGFRLGVFFGIVAIGAISTVVIWAGGCYFAVHWIHRLVHRQPVIRLPADREWREEA